MTYNVFGGTLRLTQSINQLVFVTSPVCKCENVQTNTFRESVIAIWNSFAESLR